MRRLPRGRRPRASRSRGGGAEPDGSRERIFGAAAKEFAAHGFAGANVDRIAAAAGLNKAMIYYHFRSKAALYREILRDMFAAAGVRVRNIAGSPAAADQKIRQFVEAIASEAEARPHFPPIWLREIAEGGARLDPATLRQIGGIIGTLGAIVTEGARAGRFQPVSPLLVHVGIVGPMLMFFATAPLRRRIDQAGVTGAALLGRDDVVAHVQRITLGVLEGRI